MEDNQPFDKRLIKIIFYAKMAENVFNFSPAQSKDMMMKNDFSKSESHP